MKERIENEINTPLEELNLWVDDVLLEEEDGIKYLRIVLDSNNVIDLDKIVLATRIIDPIITNMDLIEDSYVLDIYAKEKGEV